MPPSWFYYRENVPEYIKEVYSHEYIHGILGRNMVQIPFNEEYITYPLGKAIAEGIDSFSDFSINRNPKGNIHVDNCPLFYCDLFYDLCYWLGFDLDYENDMGDVSQFFSLWRENIPTMATIGNVKCMMDFVTDFNTYNYFVENICKNPNTNDCNCFDNLGNRDNDCSSFDGYKGYIDSTNSYYFINPNSCGNY